MRLCMTSVFLLLVTVLGLSCSGDLNIANSGELPDQYERKFLPDPFLSGLSTSLSTALVPAFGIERTNYMIGVPAGTASFTITPVSRSSTSRITVNGETVLSGMASQPIVPATGTTRVPVRVTDRDGLSVFTYTVSAVLLTGSENGDSSLSSLVVGPTNILSFTPATTTYSCAVNFDITSASVTPAASHAAARIFVNNQQVASGSSLAIPLAVGVNTVSIRVVAENFTETTYTVTITRTTPALFGLLISEWADAGTNVDYIELWNSGSQSLSITRDFRILIGTTEISLSKYGTSSNVSIFASIPTSGGVTIAPNEVILVVDSDVSATNLNTIIGWGVPAGTKFFTSSESTLIGTTGDRLDDNRAFLKSGSYEWSHTPDPAAFAAAGMTSTYSKLRSTYNPATDSYTNIAVWQNGSTTIRSPGTRN